jgi:8-oxo-dGTP pyrophosphatase MutT (NUDIX family)
MEPVSVKGILQGPRGVLFVKNPRDEWELPGGRPEPGEDLETALVREVSEECGVTVASADYVGSKSCEIVPGKRVLLVFFRCLYTGSDFALSHEHTAYRWVDPAGVCPQDLPEFYWNACRRAA